MGSDNASIVEELIKRLPCQVGGGVRSATDARRWLDDGAKRVIVGSALVTGDKLEKAFAARLASALGNDRVVFAIDSSQGRIATWGWKQTSAITPGEMIDALQDYCDAFLYTHIDTEGIMRGFPLDVARQLRNRSRKRLIVAGGIASQEEIEMLESLQVDAVVGMAIYTERLLT